MLGDSSGPVYPPPASVQTADYPSVLFIDENIIIILTVVC